MGQVQTWEIRNMRKAAQFMKDVDEGRIIQVLSIKYNPENDSIKVKFYA